MICHDCDEQIIESERPAAVRCSTCGVVMHAECRMSDPGTVKDYCEPCYYSFTRHVLVRQRAEPEPEEPEVGLLVYQRGDA